MPVETGRRLPLVITAFFSVNLGGDVPVDFFSFGVAADTELLTDCSLFKCVSSRGGEGPIQTLCFSFGSFFIANGDGDCLGGELPTPILCFDIGDSLCGDCVTVLLYKVC